LFSFYADNPETGLVGLIEQGEPALFCHCQRVADSGFLFQQQILIALSIDAAVRRYRLTAHRLIPLTLSARRRRETAKPVLFE
jgi:hypothetical protein